MRDIRFRAWDKDRSKMWNTITIESIDFARNRLTVLYDLNITPDGQNSGIYSDTLGRFELMQYTGLKDKNGKEIYEGDIFRIEEDEEDLIFYVVIVWVQEWCMFATLRVDDEYQAYLNGGVKALDEPMFWTYTLEDTNSRKHYLCGNIYEHPELIKDTAVGDRT